MKLSIDGVPLSKLRYLVKEIFTKKGIALLAGVIILPVNLAVAEPSAQANGSDAFGEGLAVVNHPVLVEFIQDKMTVTATSYNSHPGQTDDTPCIAARGYDLCEANMENVIAANFLPMGAKISIPELYGDQIFTVVDRMNSRYPRVCSDTDCRIDLWKRDYSDARNFGKQTVEIVVHSRA